MSGPKAGHLTGRGEGEHVGNPGWERTKSCRRWKRRTGRSFPRKRDQAPEPPIVLAAALPGAPILDRKGAPKKAKKGYGSSSQPRGEMAGSSALRLLGLQPVHQFNCHVLAADRNHLDAHTLPMIINYLTALERQARMQVTSMRPAAPGHGRCYARSHPQSFGLRRRRVSAPRRGTEGSAETPEGERPPRQPRRCPGNGDHGQRIDLVMTVGDTRINKARRARRSPGAPALCRACVPGPSRRDAAAFGPTGGCTGVR